MCVCALMCVYRNIILYRQRTKKKNIRVFEYVVFVFMFYRRGGQVFCFGIDFIGAEVSKGHFFFLPK